MNSQGFSSKIRGCYVTGIKSSYLKNMYANTKFILRLYFYLL